MNLDVIWLSNSNTGITIWTYMSYGFLIQSNLGYPNVIYPKLLGYSKTMDSPDFFLYYLLQ